MLPYASIELAAWCMAAAAEYGWGFSGSVGASDVVVPLPYWLRRESEKSYPFDDGCIDEDFALFAAATAAAAAADGSRGETLLGGVIALW